MNKTFCIAVAFILAFSAAAFAELGTNISILYGWNGTHGEVMI